MTDSISNMQALLFSQMKLIRVLLIDEFEYMQRNLRKAFALLTISFIIFYTTPSRSLWITFVYSSLDMCITFSIGNAFEFIFLLEMHLNSSTTNTNSKV